MQPVSDPRQLSVLHQILNMNSMGDGDPQGDESPRSGPIHAEAREFPRVWFRDPSISSEE